MKQEKLDELLKTKFNIGDEVVMNKDLIIEEFSVLPIWYSDEVFIIDEILTKKTNGEIVKLDKDLASNFIARHSNRKISSAWLKLSVKHQRKRKLQKINSNNSL